MRIYIKGQPNSRTGFKITKTNAYSTLDTIIAEYLDIQIKRAIEGLRTPSLEDHFTGLSKPKVYYIDVDSGVSAKSVTKKLWVKTLKEFYETNPGKVAKYELVRSR